MFESDCKKGRTLFGKGTQLNIKAVAKKADVSVTTVSRVLNHPESVSVKTREHILGVMKQMNYTPNWFARNIQSAKTGVIGLIVPDMLDPVNMEIAKGISDGAHQKSYSIMLCNTDFDLEKERAYVESFTGRRVDGLIFISSLLKKADLQRLKKNGVPYVLAGQNYSMENENVVYTDYKGGAEEAVTHLTEMGHKRIAMILGQTPKAENVEKLEGYKMALKKAKIPFRPELIVTGQNNMEGGFVATSKLLALQQRPDAIFASTDTMAFGAMEKIKQTDLNIPKDMALIGFNDLKTGAVVEPKLTTVTIPMYRMGLLAARLLFDIIEEGAGTIIGQEVMLQSKLKIRKSCGNKERLREIW